MVRDLRDSQAWIVRTDGREMASVPVNAEDAQATVRWMGAFLQDPTRVSSSWMTYADFTFGLVAGGALTMMPLQGGLPDRQIHPEFEVSNP